jgi:hypothetical protein
MSSALYPVRPRRTSVSPLFHPFTLIFNLLHLPRLALTPQTDMSSRSQHRAGPAPNASVAMGNGVHARLAENFDAIRAHFDALNSELVVVRDQRDGLDQQCTRSALLFCLYAN